MVDQVDRVVQILIVRRLGVGGAGQRASALLDLQVRRCVEQVVHVARSAPPMNVDLEALVLGAATGSRRRCRRR